MHGLLICRDDSGGVCVCVWEGRVLMAVIAHRGCDAENNKATHITSLRFTIFITSE